MRKNPHATTNAGNQGNRAPPPPATTTHQVHNPQPPLERRLQEGPRRQSASTVRPKGQGFRPGKGGGGGGQIWKLDPPSRGRAAPERRRRRGRREIDQGFPPFQVSTAPSSKPRSDEPATRSARGDHCRREGAGRKRAAHRCSKTSPSSRHPRGREGRPSPTRIIHRRNRRLHLHPGPPPWLPKLLTPARGSRSSPPPSPEDARQPAGSSGGGVEGAGGRRGGGG